MRTGTPSFLAAALEASIGSGSYKEFIKMIQNKGKGAKEDWGFPSGSVVKNLPAMQEM